MQDVFIDTETRSPVNLTTEGDDRYTANCECTMIQWAVDDDDVSLWDPFTDGPELPRDLEEILADNSISLIAHNAAFDRKVFSRALKKSIPITRWLCTRAQAYSVGLPGSLDTLGLVLGLSEEERKLSSGKALIDLFCKPLADGTFRSPYDFPLEWETFRQYGKQDTATLRTIYRRLPRVNYTGTNLRQWHVDQLSNGRGFGFDQDLAGAAVALLAKAKGKADREVHDATLGSVGAVTQRDKFLNYIVAQGTYLKDLRAGTIREALESSDLPVSMRMLLELRLEASKSSGSKYKRGLTLVGRDSRIRGAVQFSGAGRTGRFSHKGFQPGNLARPTMAVYVEDKSGIVESSGGVRGAVRGEQPRQSASSGQDAAVPPADRSGSLPLYPGASNIAAPEQQGLHAGEAAQAESHAHLHSAPTSGIGVHTTDGAGSGSHRQGTVEQCADQSPLGNSVAEPDGGKPKKKMKLILEPVKAKYIDEIIIPAIYSGAALHNPEIYGGPMTAGALALRHCIKAAVGCELVVADFSNIEGCITAWVAGEEWKLTALREKFAGTGPDVYKLLYSRFFHKLIDTINDTERQAGKVVDLSMGFHGGVGAFATMASGYGIDLSILPALVLPDAPQKMLDKAYKAWRRAFLTGQDYLLEPKVYQACDVLKQLYRMASPAIDSVAYDIDKATKGAMQAPNCLFEAARCKIWYTGRELIIQLPSGRRLTYLDPQIHQTKQVDPVTGGDLRISTSISYMSARGKTWFRIKAWMGLFLENIVQAIAADLLRAALVRVHDYCNTVPAIRDYLSQLPDDERSAIALHVHDEVVADVPVGSLSLAKLIELMCTKDECYKDLPLHAEGWIYPVYGKR